MAIEIERKFLVDITSIKELSSYPNKKIIQGYLFYLYPY